MKPPTSISKKNSTDPIASIVITDVTLRDGLQAEAKFIPWREKIELWHRLRPLPYHRWEVASSINPKWVPQFNENEEFCRELYSSPVALPETMAFVPNLKGCERLIAYPIPWVSSFIAASETFNKKNVNASIDDTLLELAKIARLTRAEGRKLRVYVSTVFGCPYEGEITLEKLMGLLKGLVDLNPDEIALSDTIGVAVPPQMRAILYAFQSLYPVQKTALHLHNTYDLALANSQAGYDAGVRIFDGSTGGIGGCPYAKGATGNVASEDLFYLFQRQTGSRPVSPPHLKSCLEYLKDNLGLNLHSAINAIIDKGGTPYASQ